MSKGLPRAHKIPNKPSVKFTDRVLQTLGLKRKPAPDTPAAKGPKGFSGRARKTEERKGLRRLIPGKK